MDARTATEEAGARSNGNGIASGHNGLPQLIDVATLAELLRFTERTIRRRVARGEIPHYRLGNSIRFGAAEVEAWLASSRVVARTQNAAGVKNGTKP